MHKVELPVYISKWLLRVPSVHDSSHSKKTNFLSVVCMSLGSFQIEDIAENAV